MIKKRTLGCVTQLRVREAEGGGESRTIEGYALLFGVRSRMLCDWWDNYCEVLEFGCLTKETLDKQDIKLTMFHDRQLILARSNKGKGTLSYEVDGKGVRFWADMPHTADGDKALELVARGDLAGCSFCYSTDESDSENAVSYEKVTDENGEEVMLRHVKRIDAVYDFTLAADPAYEQTSVSRREAVDGGAELDEEKKDGGKLPDPENAPAADDETQDPEREEGEEVDEGKKAANLQALEKEMQGFKF